MKNPLKVFEQNPHGSFFSTYVKSVNPLNPSKKKNFKTLREITIFSIKKNGKVHLFKF